MADYFDLRPGSIAARAYSEGSITLAEALAMDAPKKSWPRQWAEGLWWRVSFAWWLLTNWRAK